MRHWRAALVKTNLTSRDLHQTVPTAARPALSQLRLPECLVLIEIQECWEDWWCGRPCVGPTQGAQLVSPGGPPRPQHCHK